jgi:hypothetical protein
VVADAGSDDHEVVVEPAARGRAIARRRRNQHAPPSGHQLRVHRGEWNWRASRLRAQARIHRRRRERASRGRTGARASGSCRPRLPQALPPPPPTRARVPTAGYCHARPPPNAAPAPHRGERTQGPPPLPLPRNEIL